MAYFDDVCVVYAPFRVRTVTQIVEEVTPTSASITGKPKCGTVVEWNPVGSWTSLAQFSQSIPRLSCGKVTRDCHSTERGLRVLECPIGSPEFVAARLFAKSEEQRSFFQRIPLVLIFRQHGCCCSIVEPPGPISGCATLAQTFWYAQQHDNVWDCFSRLTGFSHESPEAG